MIILLGASLCVGIIFLIAFIWSVKAGQMDDTFSPAHKIFFDDTITKSATNPSHTSNSKEEAIN